LWGEVQDQNFGPVEWWVLKNILKPVVNVPTAKYFKDLEICAAENAVPLDGKLVPIIFSHGTASQAASYSLHQIEMASHGYVVFGIDHDDGTCFYTES
jgi:predicted dienelactone hydrolase